MFFLRNPRRLRFVRAARAGFCLVAMTSAARAAVVINELLYRPGTTVPENTQLEFLELHNTGAATVSLNGWQISKGVSFVFPNVIIAPGSFAIVAANVPAFQAAHPGVTNVYGPWTGTLSNRGEKIELRNDTGAVVDVVEYFPEGDWAVRTRSNVAPTAGGWLWVSPADGGGASLELRNPALPHDRGQNWGFGPVAGTAGAVNSVAAANVAPLITQVTHSPPIPTSTQPVTISCRLEDENMATAAATVFWRVSAATPFSFVPQPMTANADGIFTATISAKANNAVVEFYVRATDGVLTRTWPALTNEGQTANALYQVSNAAETFTAAHYRLILSVPEAATFASIDRQSDAEMNTTLITPDAGEDSGYTIRYSCSTRIRGNSSRTYNPPPLRIEIPVDRPWGDIQRMNLNTRYPWAQTFGMKLMSAAGLVAPDARGVKVSLNGTDRALVNATLGGLHIHEEPIDAHFLERHLPEDSGGNLYQKRSANTYQGFSRDFQRWGVVGASILHYNVAQWYLAEEWSKGSNAAENNWTDLQNFVVTMNTATPVNYLTQVGARVNIEQWLRWLATLTLLNDYETNLSNGIDDDYLMYRGEKDPRFILFPHDLDTILGQGDTTSPPTGSLFPFVTDETGIQGADVIPQLNAFIQQPVIRARYLAVMRELLAGPFSKAQFDGLIHNVLDGWATPATVAAMIGYMDARRTYALSVADGSLTAGSTLPVQNGFPRATAAAASVTGTFDLSDTAQVLVNGLAATLPANAASATVANWTRNVALTPGINRVTVQSLDATGKVLETRTLDVWFDDGSTQAITGPIATDTTLTAAGGPYTLSGDVVVEPGATLTIQAGTNLWLAKDARLIVQGALRVLGTPFSHVRFCPSPTAPNEADPASAGLPASPPKSRGLQFLNSLSEQNLVQWLDVLHAQNAEGAIGAINSQAVLDRVTFAGTHLRMIYGSDAELIVQNSTFPNMFATAESPLALGLEAASEHVRIESSGRESVFRDNTFGTNKGRNAVLSLIGGLRPGPILQVLDNTFAGSGNKVIDVTGDAIIAGNTFRNVTRDPAITDGEYASAIATTHVAEDTTVMIARNTFWDVDRAVHLRENTAAFFENNTVVKVHDAPNDGSAINFFSTEPGGSAGDGAFAADNIFTNAPRIFGNADQPNGKVSQLEFTSNLLSRALAQTPISVARPAPVTTLGPGNVAGDPHFTNEAAGVFTLPADSPAKGAGRFGQDFGGLVPPGILISNEPAATTAASSALLRVGGPGIVAFRWRLNGGAWSADTAIGNGGAFDRTAPQVRSATIALTDLAPGTYTVEALGQDFAGVWQSTPAISKTWTVDPAFSAVRINEILADNRGTVNVGGAFPDLIELHNPGGSAIDLSGKSLSDDAAVPAKFIFPNGTNIPPGGYLVIAADSATSAGLHTGFGLGAEGDGVYLFDDSAHGRALLDAVVFGLQAPGFSIGRSGANAAWKLTQPTFGAANIAQSLGDSSRLRLNEWLAASQVKFDDDFIELYNPDTLPVALGGLHLSDDPLGEPDKFTIRALSFIPANGFAVFHNSGPADSATLLNFNLSAQYEDLALFAADFTRVDFVNFANERNDIAQGRTPDGGATITSFTLPTPGMANFASGSEFNRMAALLAGLRISEVMYHPPTNADAEYIEFINIGSTTLDLTAVRLTQAVEFTFGNVQLPPGNRILVARSLSVMQAIYGPNVYVAGQWSGRLDNAGERIDLLLPAPFEAAILSFTYAEDWAPATDGSGKSLEIVNVNAAPVAWQTAANWTASAQDGGSPALLLTPVITSGGSGSGILGDAFIYQILANHNPASFGASGLPVGLSVNAGNGAISGRPTVFGTFNVTLTAANSDGVGVRNLQLTIASSGPLANFLWSPITGPKVAGTPFTVSVRAVDAQGRAVTSFAGPVALSAFTTNAAISPIVVTELDTDLTDYFEIQNVTNAPVDTTGWFLVANNATAGNIGSVHNAFPALPNPMVPGQVVYRTDIASDTANYFGTNIAWPGAGCWVMIVDDTGRIRDFVAVGYSQAQIAALTVFANGFTLSPGAQWSGAGVSIANNTENTVLLRGGVSDHNDASDWAWSPTPDTFGTPNSGLALPFPSSNLNVAVTPTSLGNFSGGVWTGNVTVAAAAIALRLQLDDGAGKLANTNAFDVQADTDSDGLPDAWETLYGFDPATSGEAALDADDDDQTNAAEFYAGTNPRSGASRLTVVGSQRVGTDLTITWNAVAGRRYRVFGRPTLTEGAWNLLTPVSITAGSATASWTHAGALTNESYFYRVEIAP